VSIPIALKFSVQIATRPPVILPHQIDVVLFCITRLVLWDTSRMCHCCMHCVKRNCVRAHHHSTGFMGYQSNVSLSLLLLSCHTLACYSKLQNVICSFLCLGCIHDDALSVPPVVCSSVWLGFVLCTHHLSARPLLHMEEYW